MYFNSTCIASLRYAPTYLSPSLLQDSQISQDVVGPQPVIITVISVILVFIKIIGHAFYARRLQCCNNEIRSKIRKHLRKRHKMLTIKVRMRVDPRIHGPFYKKILDAIERVV